MLVVEAWPVSERRHVPPLGRRINVAGSRSSLRSSGSCTLALGDDTIERDRKPHPGPSWRSTN